MIVIFVSLQTVQDVYYENETDLLAVVSVNQEQDDPRAFVCFHDNGTGELLKEIELEQSWQEVRK